MTLERVLIVEDEVLTADTYAHYLSRAGGYLLEYRASTLADAVRFLSAQRRERGSFGVDLVLLDMNLPDGHGLEVLRQMRSAGFTGAVLAMTASTDMETIRQAMALGVVQYLVKPFGYPEFSERLRSVRELSSGLSGTGSVTSQEEVDRAFRHHEAGGASDLPKGLTEDTLSSVIAALQPPDHPDAGHSAGEVGSAVGTSRVTARRYLEHLHRRGMVERTPRHGAPGRPENEYRWTGTST